MKYYLIKGKIMKGYEMPEIDDFTNTTNYIGAHEDWTDSLQPCDISESEKAKIIHTILVNNTDVILSNPIEVTDIIEEKESISNLDSFITFKVKEDSEAVEFLDWSYINAAFDIENGIGKWQTMDKRNLTSKQLYEIFKSK